MPYKTPKGLRQEISEIYAGADGRELTQQERGRVEACMELLEQHERIEAKAREIGGPPSDNTAGDPGATFINSANYKMVSSSELRGQSWSTGPVEVGHLGYQLKGTMVEGAGGTLVPPHYTGGIVRQNFTPVGLADYFSQEQTTSNSVRYSLEGTATNAATGVPELGVKPESNLALSEVDEKVKKLAHTLAVSDELMDDAPGLRGYINERMSLFIRLREEEQILRGSGGDNLTGIFSRGISTLGLGTLWRTTFRSSVLRPVSEARLLLILTWWCFTETTG
jgi:HK97 family phage major capsid protein